MSHRKLVELRKPLPFRSEVSLLVDKWPWVKTHGSHFGLGAPPVLDHFSLFEWGDWDVHGGLTGILTRGPVSSEWSAAQ